MASKLLMLQRLSKRADTRTSDKIPLRMVDPEADTEEKVDLSEGGTYFVQFADPGGVAYDNFYAAVRQEEVTREATGKDAAGVRERSLLTHRIWPGIESLVNDGVILDGVFPAMQAGGMIQGRKWAGNAEDDLKWLAAAPRPLHEWLFVEAMEFLEAPDELADEVGNSSKPTESGSGPPEPETNQ